MAQIWVNSLAHLLMQTGLVKDVLIWPAKLIVRYKTKVIERYWLINKKRRKHIIIDRQNSRITERIPINSLKEQNIIGDTESPYEYFVISKRAWRTGTTIDRAIAIQDLIIKICDLGYQGRQPYDIITDDLFKLRLNIGTNCVVNGVIDFFPARTKRLGRLVQRHFIDVENAPRPPHRSSILMAAKNHRIVYRLVRGLTKRCRLISSNAVMTRLFHSYGPKIATPLAYCALLQQLGATSIYDPHPETGSKAMACALLGIPYYTDRNQLFDDALERGFAGFIGLDHRYVGSGRPDVAVIDANFAGIDYDVALDYAERAEHLAVAVSATNSNMAMDICMPDRIIDADASGKRFHYFIW